MMTLTVVIRLNQWAMYRVVGRAKGEVERRATILKLNQAYLWVAQINTIQKLWLTNSKNIWKMIITFQFQLQEALAEEAIKEVSQMMKIHLHTLNQWLWRILLIKTWKVSKWAILNISDRNIYQEEVALMMLKTHPKKKNQRANQNQQREKNELEK